MIYEHLIELPSSIKGFSRMDANGDFHIYYNSACISEETFRHEMRHIQNNDWGYPDNEELR